jgi:UDP-glucose 4-epimerase
MTRVLVTGSSGYIGRALVRELLAGERVETVVGVDVVAPAAPQNGFEFALHDVCAPLDPLLRQHRVNTIVHAAFVVRPTHDVARMWRTNVEGTRQVLRSARDCGVRHLIYLSSATVYGPQADGSVPFVETQGLNPHPGFAYAESKVATEVLVDTARATGVIPSITVLRPCFVVGGGSDNPLFEHLARRWVILPRTKAALQLTHVNDLTSIIRTIIAESVSGVFNVAGTGALTPMEMVQRIGGTPVPFPPALLRTLNSMAWRTHAGFLTPAPSSALVLLEKPWMIDAGALRREVGYRLQYTTEGAFETLAAQLRHRFALRRR